MSTEIDHKITPEVVPVQPDELVEIPLSSESLLRMETYITEWGFGGVVGSWGRRYPKEETDEMVASIWGADKITNEAGFTELWRVPPGTSNEQAIEDELAVVGRATEQVLKIHNLHPEQIEFMFLGSGAAIVDHPDVIRYSRTVAELNGLHHLVPEDPLDPDALLYDRYLACYSGGSAMRAALLNPKLQGKIGLFINVEGLTRLTPDISPSNTNALPPQFFSNGIAAYIMIPGETFKIVLDDHGKPIEEEHVVPDLHNALAARVPYRPLMDQEALAQGVIFQRIGNTDMIDLPTPKDGRMIDMHGGRTGMLFLGDENNKMPRIVNRVWGRTLTKYPELIGTRPKLRKEIKTNVHGASRRVVEGLNSMTSNDVVFEWGNNPDGNKSAASNTTALIRAAKRYKTGDKVLSAVMGGGSIQGAIVLEIGETHLQ